MGASGPSDVLALAPESEASSSERACVATACILQYCVAQHSDGVRDGVLYGMLNFLHENAHLTQGHGEGGRADVLSSAEFLDVLGEGLRQQSVLDSSRVGVDDWNQRPPV